MHLVFSPKLRNEPSANRGDISTRRLQDNRTPPEQRTVSESTLLDQAAEVGLMARQPDLSADAGVLAAMRVIDSPTSE